MNRLALMVLKNIPAVPGLYAKLCSYANKVGTYPEQESWDHIAKIMNRAIKAGNVDLVVTGLENIPAPSEGGFMMYGNHQGLFDVVAISATCPTPLGGAEEGAEGCASGQADCGLHQVFSHGPGGCASVPGGHQGGHR